MVFRAFREINIRIAGTLKMAINCGHRACQDLGQKYDCGGWYYRRGVNVGSKGEQGRWWLEQCGKWRFPMVLAWVQ